MSTRQKVIRQALITALTAGVPGVNIFQSRNRPLELPDLPAVLVYGQDDQPEDPHGNHDLPHMRTYTIRVELRMIGRPEDDATDATADLIRKAVFAWCADDNFANYASRVSFANQQWDGVEADQPYAACALDFGITYLFQP